MILTKLAEKLGGELCEHYIAQQLMAMTEDLHTDVCKAALENLSKLSEVVSKHFIYVLFHKDIPNLSEVWVFLFIACVKIPVGK